jgi:hypothetical protein
MSNHKTPLTDFERKGLEAHGLGRHIGIPSQLADAFRQGIAWALNAAPQPQPYDTALYRHVLYLIDAWERGCDSADYWREIAALRERLQ